MVKRAKWVGLGIFLVAAIAVCAWMVSVGPEVPLYTILSLAVF